MELGRGPVIALSRNWASGHGRRSHGVGRREHRCSKAVNGGFGRDGGIDGERCFIEPLL